MSALLQSTFFPQGRAIISEDGRYRYSLTRTWDHGKGRVAFIMLNPSTADASHDDPTIRRCIGFARDWGYGSLEVGNLFALRATDPAELREAADPIGPLNDDALRDITKRAHVVIAWGVHPFARQQADHVLSMVATYAYVLGLTKDGHPRHPLYMPKDAKPIPYMTALVGEQGERE